MVIKKAPPRLLSIERGSRACVCQVIDKSETPFLLVSVYLDGDLADVCSRNILGRSGVKVVERDREADSDSTGRLRALPPLINTQSRPLRGNYEWQDLKAIRACVLCRRDVQKRDFGREINGNSGGPPRTRGGCAVQRGLCKALP